MEKLIADFDSQVSCIFEVAPPRRSIYLCGSESLEHLPQRIQCVTKNFGLLLALDAANLPCDQIYQVASTLLDKGLGYLCSWGLDCERVHDIFDQAAIKVNETFTGDDVVMTTWHSDESFEETLWFFAHAAFPTKCFQHTCTSWIVAPIANPVLEEQIRTQIHQIVFAPPKD